VSPLSRLFNKLMGVYCLDLVTPGTYLLNTMDKTDIVHALNQYVEKLNIVLKTFKNNGFIHNFNAKCLWCYTIFMVTPLTITPQTNRYVFSG
jgi:CRISPR/Cas system CMR-associated protein Cmr1 (group 7 of RAMP superfamily)